MRATHSFRIATAVLVLLLASALIGNAATSPAPPDLIEEAKQTVISWSGYFQALALLFGILGLLWFAVWLLRRRSDMRIVQGLGLRIESRLALGPKKWLIVARFLDKRIMLGVTDHQITLLSEHPLEEMPVSKAPQTPSFKAHIAAAQKMENTG